MKVWKIVTEDYKMFYVGDAPPDKMPNTLPEGHGDPHVIVMVPMEDISYDFLEGLELDEAIKEATDKPVEYYRTFGFSNGSGLIDRLKSVLNPYTNRPYAELDPYLQAIREEVARHYPEKRDTWKTCPIKDLYAALWGAWDDLVQGGDDLDPHQAVDVGALLAMIYMRKTRHTDHCAHLSHPGKTPHFPPKCGVMEAKKA